MQQKVADGTNTTSPLDLEQPHRKPQHPKLTMRGSVISVKSAIQPFVAYATKGCIGKINSPHPETRRAPGSVVPGTPGSRSRYGRPILPESLIREAPRRV